MTEIETRWALRQAVDRFQLTKKILGDAYAAQGHNRPSQHINALIEQLEQEKQEVYKLRAEMRRFLK